MSMAIKVARLQTQGSGRVMPGIGDPGLFGFLGSVVKTGLQSLPGPIGTIAQRVFKPGVGATISNGTIVSQFAQSQDELVGPPKPGFIAAAQRAVRGGATGREQAQGTLKLACATGHRPNKSDYFLKDGTFIQKGTKCVKNRRRNDLNPRALDRAMGRIVGAKAKEAKLKRITIRKKCG